MTAKENRELKSSVFVDLFYEDESAEENDISLYNALHDEPLPEGTEIEKIRVENTIYLNFQNDISFGVEGKVIVFGEHQSTINGTMLDLGVKVINISPDEQHEILDKCQVLKEYGQFIDVVNKYQEEGNPEAYKCAIEECIEKGILSDYLRRKGSEVVNMLIAEYDYDLDIEVQREEAFEDGMEAGTNRINELNNRLIEDDRLEDLQKATKDKDYQEKLMEEYGL